MTGRFLYLPLLLQVFASVAWDYCEAAPYETATQTSSIRNPNVGTGEVDIDEETDFFDDLLANFARWMDRFLAADATRNTSVISSWNH